MSDDGPGQARVPDVAPGANDIRYDVNVEVRHFWKSLWEHARRDGGRNWTLFEKALSASGPFGSLIHYFVILAYSYFKGAGNIFTVQTRHAGLADATPIKFLAISLTFFS